MLDLSYPFLLAVTATFLVAGVVKGVTGMGLPTVAMGVLGALFSPLTAAALLIVPSLVTNVWQLVTGPFLRALGARLWPMMLAIVVGTVAGSSMLTGGDTQMTTLALGIALVAYAVYTLVARPFRVPEAAEWWLSPLIGLVTGLVTGGTGVFVIPAVPYLQSLGLEKDELVQALGLSFTISTIALALWLGLRGSYQADGMTLSMLAVAPALLGMWAGQYVRRAVSAAMFKRWFLIALALLGGEMIFRSIG